MSPFYLARGASKLVRRITSETSVELKILSDKWRLLLAGLIFQYIHGLAAHGVHYLHRPGPTLQDLGFMILPELGKERGYISETLFTFIFLTFVLVLISLSLSLSLSLSSFLSSLSIGIDGHDCTLEVGYFVLNKRTNNFAIILDG